MFISTSFLTYLSAVGPFNFILYLPLSFLFFHYDFISVTTLHSDPTGRFLQHFNRALKITAFSFIHTGFAIMQPLWAGRLEVNPLSHHYPYKLLSDSSVPNTDRPHLPLWGIHSPCSFSISKDKNIGKNLNFGERKIGLLSVLPTLYNTLPLFEEKIGQ